MINNDRTDKPPDRQDWIVKFNEALPHWKKWSRTLRRVFVLLPSHGADKDGLRDIAEDIGKDYDGLIKLINRTKTFKDQLEYYRDTGVLAALNKPINWHVGVHDVANMLARESSALALVQIDISKGKAPTVAVQLAAKSGYLDHVDPKKGGFSDNDTSKNGRSAMGDSGLTSFHTENATTL